MPLLQRLVGPCFGAPRHNLLQVQEPSSSLSLGRVDGGSIRLEESQACLQHSAVAQPAAQRRPIAGVHVNIPASESSLPSARPSTNDTRCELGGELLSNCPYLHTAIGLDGRHIWQNPRSLTYFGDLSMEAASGGDEIRAGLTMSVLQRLFQFEIEDVLEEMLSAVLDGEQSKSWCRVVQVPVSLANTPDQSSQAQLQTQHQGVVDAQGEGEAAQAMQGDQSHAQGVAHMRAQGVSFASTMPASFRQQLTTAMTSDTDGGEHASTHGSCATPRAPASGQGSRADDASVRGSVDSRAAGHSGVLAKVEAEAVSVGMRNAPARVKSLLDLSRKSCGSPRAASHLHKHSSFQLAPGALPRLHENELLPGGCTSPLPTRLMDTGPPPAQSISQPQYLGWAAAARASQTESEAVLDPVACGISPVKLSALAAPGSWRGSLDIMRTGSQTGPVNSQALAGLLECAEEEAQESASGLHSQLMDKHGKGQEGRDEQQQEEEEVEGEEQAAACWHEVHISRTHKGDGSDVLLIYQSDVTVRTELEQSLAKLTELQLNTLCEIFPRHVVEFLSSGGNMARPANLGHLARSSSDVSILFMDVVGFTCMSKVVAPDAVMVFINNLFSVFDELCTVHHVYKVETAGDCYIVSSGLLVTDGEGFAEVAQTHDPISSAARLFAFAQAMLSSSRQVLMPHNNMPVQVRIGIHTGPCVSGVVGSKLPKYCVFGDTMNTASRMESTCIPGRLQVSASTHALLLAGECAACDWEATGGIEVKGKGVMQTFLWMEPPVTAAATSVPPKHVPTQSRISLIAARANSASAEPAKGAPSDQPRAARNKNPSTSATAHPPVSGRDPDGGVRFSSSALSRRPPQPKAALRRMNTSQSLNSGNDFSTLNAGSSNFNAMSQLVFQLAKRGGGGPWTNRVRSNPSHAVDLLTSSLSNLHTLCASLDERQLAHAHGSSLRGSVSHRTLNTAQLAERSARADAPDFLCTTDH